MIIFIKFIWNQFLQFWIILSFFLNDLKQLIDCKRYEELSELKYISPA